MTAMTLPFKHRIRNSSPGGLSPSTLSTILNLYEGAGKKHSVYLKLEGQCGVRNRDLRLSKQASLTTVLRPRPMVLTRFQRKPIIEM